MCNLQEAQNKRIATDPVTCRALHFDCICCTCWNVLCVFPAVPNNARWPQEVGTSWLQTTADLLLPVCLCGVCVFPAKAETGSVASTIFEAAPALFGLPPEEESRWLAHADWLLPVCLCRCALCVFPAVGDIVSVAFTTLYLLALWTTTKRMMVAAINRRIQRRLRMFQFVTVAGWFHHATLSCNTMLLVKCFVCQAFRHGVPRCIVYDYTTLLGDVCT